MQKKAIEHQGIVTKIENDSVTVEIQVQSACASCEAHGTCMTKDSKNREIKISGIKTNLTIGQLVTVFGEQKGGLMAVFLAYFVPFLLVLLTLIIALQLTHNNEVKSGLYSLLILFPYYGILWLLKDRLSRSFQFKIKE